MTPDPATAALVAELWERFRGVAEARVAVLERLLAAGEDASPDLRAEAVGAAHKLAGALGTYGRPGSDAARALEHLLRDGGDLAAADRLVAEVRAAVA